MSLTFSGGITLGAGTQLVGINLSPPTVEYLVVAGGGGGANFGGGGAGGVRSSVSYPVSTGTFTQTPVIRSAYADIVYSYSNNGWTTGTDFIGDTGAFVYSKAGIQDSSGGARSIILPSDGNYYFEISLSTFPFMLWGVARDSSSGGYTNVPSVFIDGGRYGGLGGSNLGAFVAGDILRIAYKAATAKVFIGRNSTWNEDPVSGAGTTIPGTGNFRIIFMSGSSGGASCTGTFRSATQNTYSTPTGYTVPASTGGISVGYVVNVGFGGAGGTTNAINGYNSSFDSIVATGGGIGGAGQTGAGQAGGSGGGGGWVGSGGAGNTPSTSPSQGNNGGAGYGVNATPFAGGGGGGAGAVGQAGQATIGGAGGVGIQSDISGTLTYYAGGGGGGHFDGSGGSASGGLGGGGNGGKYLAIVPTAGTTNTGGGGGGYGTSAQLGKQGGSGIVIIRYPNVYRFALPTGGATYTNVNGYKIYTFTSSGSITFSNGTEPIINYLVVSGGGGGGGRFGGGAGAGGMLESTTVFTLGQLFTVTVGAGGPGGPSGTGAGGAESGSLGVNSSILPNLGTLIQSTGGGGGGGWADTQNTSAKLNGGSGGGAGWSTTNPGGSGVAGQGNNGGTGTVSTTNTAGGGGGGAGQTGANGVSGVGGTGGNGLQSSITGTAIYYAGGGGGASTTGGGATGGLGGGGNAAATTGGSGTANTGGGGGAVTGVVSAAVVGGAGGSGIVIIRYANYFPAATTTGSPTVTTDGSYRVYTFTGSGTFSIPAV